MSIPRYIERLRLAGPAPEPRPAAHLKAFRDTTRSVGASPPAQPIPEGLQAAVNAGSLLSFVQDVDEQEKTDILYSMQLAQRGANGTYDRFTQTQSWYQHYIEILENLGWVAEQLAFAVHRQSEGELRMDKAALAIIAAIATQNQLAVLKEAVTALEGLAGDDDALRLFDFHSSTQMSGNFQIGAVQKGQRGAGAGPGGVLLSQRRCPAPVPVLLLGRPAGPFLDGRPEDDLQHRTLCAVARHRAAQAGGLGRRFHRPADAGLRHTPGTSGRMPCTPISN